MKSNRCKCGEPLVTRDEVARGCCWQCAGLSWRLQLLDRELSAITKTEPVVTRA